MQFEIIKNIGKRSYAFTVEGKNLFEVIQESQKLSFQDVEKCGCCGSDNLYLASHIAQEQYRYTHITCAACRAQLVFGQKKENADIFFLRRNEDKSLAWEPYNADDWNKDHKNDGSAAPKNQTKPQGKPPAQTSEPPIDTKGVRTPYVGLVYLINSIKDFDEYQKCELEIKVNLDAGKITPDEFSRAHAILDTFAKAKKIL